MFLVPWAPQLAVLLHPAVAVFATHGGMNGMAEGTYARLPLLCIPLFADQPDNCAHAADKGYAAALQLQGLTPAAFAAALAPLLPGGAARAAMAGAVQEAWVRNVAAGGAGRAVGIIEAAAALPYGAHLGEVPVAYFLPWYQQWGLDVGLALALALGAALWLCSRGCRWLCSSYCCCRSARGAEGAGSASSAEAGAEKKRH